MSRYEIADWRDLVPEGMQADIAIELDRDDGDQPALDHLSPYHEAIIRQAYLNGAQYCQHMYGILNSTRPSPGQFQTMDDSEDEALAAALHKSRITAKRERQRRHSRCAEDESIRMWKACGESIRAQVEREEDEQWRKLERRAAEAREHASQVFSQAAKRDVPPSCPMLDVSASKTGLLRPSAARLSPKLKRGRLSIISSLTDAEESDR
ncbi:hypothetical protein B0T25DRAFT_571089 [Lasiosphaeria hispida]|uniref:Uncharacterized protein n=1 Tax=Lasiosphaeria hispida TaxID=260671 RepID=A0AAJ0HAV0_9PEZI|nr:hypothetical protein B0T25DRAFT_571089 [Lasiosphaeria hispida]